MELHIDLSLPPGTTYGRALDEIAMQLAWTDADRKTPISVGDGNHHRPVYVGIKWTVTE